MMKKNLLTLALMLCTCLPVCADDPEPKPVMLDPTIVGTNGEMEDITSLVLILLQNKCPFMKSILAFFAFFLPAFFAWGEETSCNVIFQANLYNISLISVNRTDTTTEVRMRYCGVPGTEFSLPPTTFYLSDEIQNIYPLKYAKGVNLQDKNICSITGANDFFLVFEPLPPSVDIFDLRTAPEAEVCFGFWGVHTKKNVLKKIKTTKNDLPLKKETFLTPDTVTITGKIIDYMAGDKLDSLYVDVSRLVFGDANRIKRHYSQIASDGSFQFRMPVGNRTWAYICNQSLKIPVFLTPADTMMLTIVDFGRLGMNVNYSSVKGNPVMANLMKADPKYVDSRLTRHGYHGHSPEELMRTMVTGMEEARKLSTYLSWKYELDTEESHLLSTMMKSYWYSVIIGYMDVNFKNTFFHDGGSYTKKYVDYVSTLPEVESCYQFVKEINLEDDAYLLLPQQSLMSSLFYMEPVVHCLDKDVYYERLEYLLGQSVPDEWKKRNPRVRL